MEHFRPGLGLQVFIAIVLRVHASATREREYSLFCQSSRTYCSNLSPTPVILSFETLIKVSEK